MKKSNLFLVLSVTIFSVFALAGCNKAETSQMLSVTIGGEPASLDPALTNTSDTTGAYISHLLEGLVTLKSGGEVSGGVAETWSVNNEKTIYTFKLRGDAVWSDGKKVTAQDFKYAWLRVLNPQTASGWAQHMYYIKNGKQFNKGLISEEEVGITVVSDNELQVEMENPCVFFLALTTLQPYYPVRQDIIEQNKEKWTDNGHTYIGNGPYFLKEWSHNNYIELTKSNTYWNRNEVYIEDIKFHLLTDSNVAINAYEANDIDYVVNLIPINELERLREKKEIKSIRSTISRFICLNLESEILKDVRVREALSLALDREEMINILGINGTSAVSFIPYGFYNEIENKDFLEDSNSKDYIEKRSNIERAKQLLEEAGYKNGVGLPEIEFATNQSDINIMTAEVVQQQLKKLGINVRINAMEQTVFNNYRSTKQFDICIGGWWSEYPDITSYIYLFNSDDMNNCFNFNNQEFDYLYDCILEETDLAARYILLHEAEKIVMDTFVTLPLYYVNIDYLDKKNLGGIIYNSSVYINFSHAKGESDV
jgi:oligopeptide transport system substrate-binding protein